jgi:hypothetical protein
MLPFAGTVNLSMADQKKVDLAIIQALFARR